MKSPLQDQMIQTSCKNCIFALYEDQTQTGCYASRIYKYQKLDKVVEAYDNDKEFYVVKSFCNMYRNSSWNNGEADSQKAYEEASIAFDIYIDCSELNENNVAKLTEFVTKQKYYKDKYRITLYHGHDASKETRKLVLHLFTLSNHTIYISSCDNKENYLHNQLLQSKGSYAITCSVDSDYYDNILLDINSVINEDLKKCIAIKYSDIVAISTAAYKVEFFTINLNEYSPIVDSLLSRIDNTTLFFEIKDEN
jgi:hypothetical protein